MSVQSAEAFVISVEAFLNAGVRETAELNKWIKLCSKNIRGLNAATKQIAHVGQKEHLLALKGRLIGSRTLLKAITVRGGGSHMVHPNNKSWAKNRVKWEDVKAIFAGRMRTGVITNLAHKDPMGFLEDCGPLFVRRISNSLKKESFLKLNSVLCGKFIKPGIDSEMEDIKYIKTKLGVVSRDTNLSEWFAENIMIKIMVELEEFQERDSGWSLSEVVNLSINIYKYTPQLGSSYIDMPWQIKLKKACVNVQNDDEACFAWAVTSALHPRGQGEHPTRRSSYPHYSKVLKLDGITFPVTREQIAKFEKMNDISVNVYVLKKVKSTFAVSPSRLTPTKRLHHVNLLLIQDVYCDENEDVPPPKYHYVWIKNLSRLVSTQLSNRNGQKFFCDRCLHYFRNEEKLREHEQECQTQNDFKVVLPGGKLSFATYNNKEKCPFVIYADIESLLKPISIKFGRKKASRHHNSEKTQEHKACAIGYYFKCSYDDSLSIQRQYRGENCSKWFADELKTIAEDIETVYLCPIPMNKLTEEEEKIFRHASVCHICEKMLGSKRVRDHCHLTGKFRGAAHEQCNLNYQDSKTIPVVFHNLSGYDLHFLLKDIALNIEGGLKLIPNNQENFISMIKYIPETGLRFKFIDSFRFMPESLEKLGSYLKMHPIIKKEFSAYTEEQTQLLTRKGVYPYDYMTSWACMEESRLPSHKDFYSKLNESNISDEDYEHAQRVWEEFHIETLGDYTDLYLKLDVLLLSEVFEAFRDVCLGAYKLDPAHYYTAPGLSWDAMLKKTQIELDLIEDVDILMFLERGIRGGLTQCSKRHSKANNKYMANCDPSMPSKYLMYYDINAMYAWAMSQYLPYGNLKWLEGDLSNFDYNKSDDSPIGYMLEVDLEYPESIHNRHKDLPMAPNKATPPGCKQQKMLATLFSKKKYVVHYRNLKQYVSEGLVVAKIHRVLQFSQSPWLRNYIELNTELRKSATNEFEKVFFKLMNNAVFGKTMENVRNRRIIRVAGKWEGRYSAEALISKPNFHSATIIEEDLALIELLKTEVIFNKPIYVGMAVLDISKTLLYNFHYRYMKEKYGDTCRVCYTDTDSLIYEIETEDVYMDMKENLSYFDTSEYDRQNIYGIPPLHKKIPGLMKDENCGRIMEEFVGLRAKMYACKVEGAMDIKKAKGVKAYVTKQQVRFEDYLDCLFNNVEMEHTQNSIRSFKHQVYTTEQTKISLSPYDNKRYLIPGSPNTLPWGHFSIMDTQ